ncbi:MAG: 5'/3'-nucleotidase SurE [Acidimicrobiales bacterium]|nr:5'/3'-nucleotidase SurE [Acidimicrobiales bacterium]
MRILVTNDDGIDSEGLHVLTAAMADTGHELVVVAPDRDWSGSGAALGRVHTDDRIDVTRCEVPGRRDVEAWSVAGPPGMAVLAARLGAFGPLPDLVVSGINPGLNTGRAILHSGTVGAALTGQNFGLSGLAVSVQSTPPWRWDTAAALAVRLLDLVVTAPPRSVLNLNVPALPLEEVRGVRWARLAPFGEVRAAIATADPETGLQFEFRANEFPFASDTDEGLVRDGYAAVTALVGVAEAWPAEEGLEAEAPDVVERLVPGAPLHDAHRLPAEEAHLLRRPVLG